MRAALILLLSTLPAAAAAMDYEECLDLAERDPHAARAAAIGWYERAGDPAALHCEAVALTGIGAYASAADKLEEAAGSPGLPAAARAEMLAQAASLWRALERREAALEALDAALGQSETAPLLVEKAELLASMDDAEGARAALNRALELAPGDPAIMAASAAERMRAGDAIGARLEAEAALAAAPGNGRALVTLGRAERALGRKDAARRAWLAAIALDEKSELAAEARGLLQDMDGG